MQKNEQILLVKKFDKLVNFTLNCFIGLAPDIAWDINLRMEDRLGYPEAADTSSNLGVQEHRNWS